MNHNIPIDILRQSIEHSNLAHTISRLDGDRELIYVNQAFLDQTGYTHDEVINRNCRFLQGDGTSEEAVNEIRDSLKRHVPIDIEILNYKKDGTPFWNRLRMAPVFDAKNKPIAFIGIQSDVTTMREAARVEQERQKLEALGRMSGNISHEIKNALQPIKLMTEILQDWENLDAAHRQKCITILQENVALADRVTQDVLTFSRKPDNTLDTIEIIEFHRMVTHFTQNLLHSRIKLHDTFTPCTLMENHAVRVCENQIYQVLMNIVNNAIHAMDDKGQVTLHWACKTLEPADALALGIEHGAYLAVGIEDTGGGMTEKTMHSIFDPFFSTKSPQDGTGLGLSISYQIIKSFGGTIHVESHIDRGSRFTLYLPLVLS